MTYPIGVVARKTGLTAHVLRVWEKRYGAVIPKRTGTHRRTYSDADVHRLTLLRRATILGHPIGSVAKLSDEALETLVKAAEDETLEPLAGSTVDAPLMAESQIVRDCIDAVVAFDTDGLNKVLEWVAVELGYTAVLRHIIAPVAQKLGDLWSKGSLRMSHEHFATAVIRGFLLNPTRQYAGSTVTLTLVAATPQGQLHELGAVMAAALAAEVGWHALYIGPSLPAAEIAGVAFRRDARVVALSLVYPESDPNIERELRELRGFLPKKVTVLVGGRAAENYRSVIDEIGALLIKDLTHLQIELAKIRGERIEAL
jgi:MerR family transcriptional regulator, light-induced transcriptional regulator